MESIYRKYQNSIKAIRTVVTIVIGLLSSYYSHAQITEEYKGEIVEFMSTDFIDLLEKSRDYYSNIDNSVNLKTALQKEVNNTSIFINTNTIIEYDKTSERGKEVVITDRLIPFLINYGGKGLGTPSTDFECMIYENGQYLAFFTFQNVVSNDQSLHKAIFRHENNKLELRRISFGLKLPVECTGEIEVAANSISPDSPNPASSILAESPSVTQQPDPQTVNTVKPKSTIPRIIIREATNNGGIAVIYGFIQNKHANATLTDLDTGQTIDVSSRDGFFVLTKPLISTGHRQLNFRYQYGRKFITDKKLVFIKS